MRPVSSPDFDSLVAEFGAWFALRGWDVFAFQTEVWRAAALGVSGLVHAPTGTGKTLAAWLGAVARLALTPERPPAGGGSFRRVQRHGVARSVPPGCSSRGDHQHDRERQ